MFLDICYENAAPLSEQAAQRTAACCFKAEGVRLPVFASVTFVDDDTIHQINLEQRGVDQATDVLSFPTIRYPEGKTAGECEGLLRKEYDPEAQACFLGDILVSVPHALAQAEEYGHSPEREMLYLITHGLFHLMGYDHMNDDEKAKMRRMEEKALNEAGFNRVTDDELVKMAMDALRFSYSPYSHYRVGAALLSQSGRVFTGCNIENASYGATNCAERTALFKAVSEGERHFSVIAIAAEKSAPWPCGICRQALNEFTPDLRVIVSWPEGRAEKTLRELLPEGFGPESGTTEYLGKE